MYQYKKNEANHLLRFFTQLKNILLQENYLASGSSTGGASKGGMAGSSTGAISGKVPSSACAKGTAFKAKTNSKPNKSFLISLSSFAKLL